MIDSRVSNIMTQLRDAIDNSEPMLVYNSPFQLLISVILSAQTTDAQVNGVTPELFEKYPAPDELAKAPIDELERIVHSTGFYRMKAKHIREASEALVGRFGANVPDTIEELVSIPGVGRKSANVVLGACFGKPAIIVDTHFRRVVNRIGLTESQDPAKIEYELRSIVPEDDQYEFSMLINRHGRQRCTSRKPVCCECVISQVCRWPDRFEDKTGDG